MQFKPLSEQEIQNSFLLNEGIYSFEVISAKNKISKNNNEMIELQLRVWDQNGSEHIVFDYLLETMKFKLIHFCDVTGLIDKYNLGSLDAKDCEFKSGKVEIVTQEGAVKQDGSRYPNKNAVKDYVKSTGMKPLPQAEPDFKDDETIPF